MEKVKFRDITINMDNRRKPLNSSDREKISEKKLYPYCGANAIMDYVDEYLFDEEILCIAEDGGKWGKNEACSYIMREKCWVNNHAHVIKVTDKVDIRYLKYWLNYNDLNSKITGAIVRKLTQKALNELEIILPEKEKQVYICNTFDKIQEIIYFKRKQIKELEELIKSQFVEMFGNPITNDKGYPLVDFINVVKLQRGYDLPNQDRDNTGDIPVYGANGILDKHTGSKCLKGIITGRSGTIGKVYYSFEEFWPLNTTLFSIETYGNNIIYLKYLLDMFELKRFVDATGVLTLNRNVVHKQKIIKAPIELQNKFAEFVKLIDKQKFEIQKSLQEVQSLQESLMNKYFGG